MPYHRRRIRRRQERIWSQAVEEKLSIVRHRLDLPPDERILDATLIGEARSIVPLNLRAVDSWFHARLCGRGATPAEQREILEALSKLGQLLPFGVENSRRGRARRGQSTD